MGVSAAVVMVIMACMIIVIIVIGMVTMGTLIAMGLSLGGLKTAQHGFGGVQQCQSWDVGGQRVHRPLKPWGHLGAKPDQQVAICQTRGL